MSVAPSRPGRQPAGILSLRAAVADRADRLRSAVSDKLQAAYAAHRQRFSSGWLAGPSWDRIWLEAADQLIRLHRHGLGVPLDPGLYVYAQFERCRPYARPSDLIGSQASGAYQAVLRTIVRQLRGEFRLEQMRLALWLRSGGSIAAAIESPELDLMPLHRFALANRAQLAEAARRWRQEALKQCHFCKLYVEVFRPLLPPSFIQAVAGEPR